MLQSLKNDFQVTTIGVYADSATCLDRVKSRNQEIHVNISDDQILLINERVSEKDLKTDFSIDNESKSRKELNNEISTIIGQTRN